MLVGNPMLREDTDSPDAQQSSFRCFDENFGGEAGAPGTGADTRHFPERPCAGGIRTNLFFPTYIFAIYAAYVKHADTL